MKTIGIYNDVFFRQKPRFMPQKLWEVVCYRANPRSFDYMKEIFESVYPQGEIIHLARLPGDVDQVILLYPDAVGLGQRSCESFLRKQYKEIWVINGRKRHFALTDQMRFKLSTKRFLEMTLFFEFLGAPFFLSYIICVALKDRFQGKI